VRRRDDPLRLGDLGPRRALVDLAALERRRREVARGVARDSSAVVPARSRSSLRTRGSVRSGCPLT
jgi:hypothetical protein